MTEPEKPDPITPAGAIEPPAQFQSAFRVVVIHYQFHQCYDAADLAHITPRTSEYRPTLDDLMRTTGLSRTACQQHRKAYEKLLRKPSHWPKS